MFEPNKFGGVGKKKDGGGRAPRGRDDRPRGALRAAADCDWCVGCAAGPPGAGCGWPALQPAGPIRRRRRARPESSELGQPGHRLDGR